MVSQTVAVLVDGGFYHRRAKALWGDRSAHDRADELEAYCQSHLHFKISGHDEYDNLYRIFYYDCPPADNCIFHPLLKTNINLKKTALYSFMSEFQKELRSRRKVALRLGKLSKNDLHYLLSYEAQKALLSGTRSLSDLQEADFRLNIAQKGVDMRIAVDISSMAFKQQVSRIILISGDSDFVPAAKLARREGIDFILDPMGASISDDLSEHIDGIRSNWKTDPLKKGPSLSWKRSSVQKNASKTV